MDELIDLTGRVAVVTGAGRGIGAQIARRLAEAGAHVVVADLDVDAAESIATLLVDDFEVESFAAQLDVADTGTITATAGRAIAKWDRLDIWVNNAGIFPTSGPALNASDEVFDRVMTVNARGTYAGGRIAANAMTNGGVIVNVASTASFKTNLGTSAYIASKSAVVGITRSYALEFAGRGIRVLAVAPTVIETPGLEASLESLSSASIDVPARLAANPLRTAGTVDDIAKVVFFCCTSLASLMTGVTIPVDAGSLL
ncbi:SDR family NAD(P)-dependent oxidoreductase [Rhodococcus jostii]|uniref:SDR family NAD(P)-dependent oxidoreductase n=1 Tax=Rhodococcus jostii TaxID=132919 RepID=UPI00365DF7D2